MKIKLQNGRPASEDAIRALEDILGRRLCEPFRTFLRVYDGAKPEVNYFQIDACNGSAVNRFIPVGEIPKERTHIENICARAYPVAWAECGNYVVVDEDRNGAVFFWDHELPDKPTELGSSFIDFLDLLEPFDIGTIQLKQGQVKKVWVDPEFLERLKK